MVPGSVHWPGAVELCSAAPRLQRSCGESHECQSPQDAGWSRRCDPLTARGRVFIAHEWRSGQVMNHSCRCGLRMATVLRASQSPFAAAAARPSLTVCVEYTHITALCPPHPHSPPCPVSPSPSSCRRRRRCSSRHSPQAPTDVRPQSRLSGIPSPLTSTSRRLLCLAGLQTSTPALTGRRVRLAPTPNASSPPPLSTRCECFLRLWFGLVLCNSPWFQPVFFCRPSPGTSTLRDISHHDLASPDLLT